MKRSRAVLIRRIVQFFIGLALGFFLWQWTTPSYDALLARATQPLVRIDARLRNAELVARGDRIDVVSHTGEPPAINIPAPQLTFNVILLIALFASNRRPFSDRSLRAFGLSLLVVLLLHPFSLLLSIESTYAIRLGAWSDAHYGSTAQNLWVMAELVWRLAVMFGLSFACWWVASAARE